MVTLPKWSDVKTLFALAGITMLASYASKLYQIVDQSFMSQVSTEALGAHVLISYIPFAMNYIAIGVGYALIVLLNKTEPEREKAEFFSGALMGMAVLGLAVSLGVSVFSSDIVSALGITNVAGSRSYLIIMTIVSAFLGTTTIGKYTWIALRKPKRVLFADGVGCLVNAAGDYLVVKYLDTDAAKIVGVGLVTLSVQVLIFTFYAFSHRAFLILTLQSLQTFWMRAKNFIGANLLLMLLEIFDPLLLTAIIDSHGQRSLTAAFNIGFYLFSFLAVPAFALNSVGTGWISELWKKKERPELTRRLSALSATALILIFIPSTILLFFIPHILQEVYHLSSGSDAYFPTALICNLLPMALSIPMWCILNAAEKSSLLVIAGAICQFIVGIPLFYLSIHTGSYVQAAIVGIVLPAVLYAVIGAFLAAKVLNKTFSKETL